MELNSNLRDVYSFYGQPLLATGDPSSAAEAFRKDLAFNPNDFTANMQLAALLKDDEKMDEALVCLRRALRVRPGDPDVRQDQGVRSSLTTTTAGWISTW